MLIAAASAMLVVLLPFCVLHSAPDIASFQNTAKKIIWRIAVTILMENIGRKLYKPVSFY